MALSEREQKLLEEMERGLYASDADFANRVAQRSAPSAKRLIGGTALAVIGLSILLFAVIIQFAIFGVIGFLVVLTGLVVASSNATGTPAVSGGSRQVSPKAPKRPGSSFEERWDRRRGL
jgi:hypothetical protein